MTLHGYTVDFYQEWMHKADSYGMDREGCFNKAFSLFTLYNKLYVEASLKLAQNGDITLSESRSFPDKKGATKYAPMYIGHKKLQRALDENSQVNRSIEDLKIIICEHRFYINLGMLYGEHQPEKDLKLLEGMNSKGVKAKIEALLEVIYSVRCNMFHGGKQYSEIQIELLYPICIILREVTQQLYIELNT